MIDVSSSLKKKKKKEIAFFNGHKLEDVQFTELQLTWKEVICWKQDTWVLSE